MFLFLIHFLVVKRDGRTNQSIQEQIVRELGWCLMGVVVFVAVGG